MKNFISFIEQHIISLSWILWVSTLIIDLWFPSQFGFIFTPFLAGWLLLQIAILTGIVSKKYLISDRYVVVLLITLLFPIWNFLMIAMLGKDPIMGSSEGSWSVFALKKSGIFNSAFGIVSIIPLSWFIVSSFFKQFSEQSEKIDEVLRVLNEIKEGPDKD